MPYKLVKSEFYDDGSERYREWNDGLKCWYGPNGVGLHKEDGPAIIYSFGKKEYWLHGEPYMDINSYEEWAIKQILE